MARNSSYDKPISSQKERDKEREEIAKQTEEFLKEGNDIECCKQGQCLSFDNIKKEFLRGYPQKRTESKGKKKHTN